MLQDCLRLLPRCVRWSAVPPGFSAQQLCEELSAPPPCASIAVPEDDPAAPEPGLAAYPEDAHLQRVSPGEGRGGVGAEVALVGHASAAASSLSCRLGAASDVEVAIDTAVRVPLSGACYSACLCQPAQGSAPGAAPGVAPGETPGAETEGVLVGCVDLPCPAHSSHCSLGTTVIGRSAITQLEIKYHNAEVLS